MNSEPYEPLTREFFKLMDEAHAAGLWLKAARHRRPGHRRFAVTLPGGTQPLFRSDDLAAVKQWLREVGGRLAGGVVTGLRSNIP